MYLVRVTKLKERKRRGEKETINVVSHHRFDTKVEAIVFGESLLQAYPQISDSGFMTKIESIKTYKEVEL